ncbi:MAG TPA: DUF4337 domain-containing protein [Xanthobacteraceae bacterium]|jgi:hypothetical protein|nr:DUF4337 domain-containing protein [Xanthobacteraceae bacterium]
MSGGHGHGAEAGHDAKNEGTNKRIALLISVLALFLAFSETLGKSAQTSAITSNVQASDLWAFFQAKTIRMTVLRTAAETMEIEVAKITDAPVKDSMTKRIEAWRKTATQYDTDPQSREGRKELMERAKQAEEHRDLELARYHHYEFASAALQIGIVLCSASVITGMMVLVWIAAGLGVGGLAFMAIGLFAPHAVHLM